MARVLGGRRPGTNTIRRNLDDRVIEESFDGRDPESRLIGRSPGSLRWQWQQSHDGATTWDLTWQIDYRANRAVAQEAGLAPATACRRGVAVPRRSRLGHERRGRWP